jgi:molybdopterin biosynthesis enzyme
MKTIDTADAAGTVLVHDLTRIVRDEVKETVFHKGHIVRPEDIELLLSMGKTRLFVWDPGPGMVHENEAAASLAEVCGFGEGFRLSEAKEGRVNVFAEGPGLFMVDVPMLEEVNDEDEVGVAVRQSGVSVAAGDMLAAVKIIPLALNGEKIEKIKNVVAGRPLIEVRPYVPMRAAVIATGSEVFHGRIKDGFTPVVEEKLAEYGARVVFRAVCDDVTSEISGRVGEALAAGAEIIICTGGMSVDPDDLTPGAIRAAGAEIVCYGTPILPGAMFLMAYLGKVPVLGLPGCVMFGGRTIFDVIMPRIAAGMTVSRKDIRRLGHGGLCLGCEVCNFPACGFGRGWPFSL